jgi:preprotein translocase subunit YajC
MKVVLWIAVGLVTLFFIVFAFALAKTAKRADEQMERMFRDLTEGESV